MNKIKFFGAKKDKKDKRDKLYSKKFVKAIPKPELPKKYLVKDYDKLKINNQKSWGSCVGQSFSKFIEHQELIREKEIIPKKVRVEIHVSAENNNPVIIRLDKKVLGIAPTYDRFVTMLDMQEFYRFKFIAKGCQSKVVVVRPDASLEIYIGQELKVDKKDEVIIKPIPNPIKEPSLTTKLIRWIQSILNLGTKQNNPNLSSAYIQNNLSPKYLYSRCKIKDKYIKDVGTFPRTACDVLRKFGICENKFLPYEAPIPTENIPTEADKDAVKRKIYLYSKLKSDEEIKETLCENKAVPLTIRVDKKFYFFRGKKIKEDSVIDYMRSKTSYGLHSILCVGYDDDKQAFLIQNSWGESWGYKGRAWLSYKYKIIDPYELYYRWVNWQEIKLT